MVEEIPPTDSVQTGEEGEVVGEDEDGDVSCKIEKLRKVRVGSSSFPRSLSEPPHLFPTPDLLQDRKELQQRPTEQSQSEDFPSSRELPKDEIDKISERSETS